MSIFLPSFNQAQTLLSETLVNSQILKHCEATRHKALQIVTLLAQKIQINQQLLEIGALLHDIGRAHVHDITHGFIGGQILLQHKYPANIVSIVERHVLGGFSANEAIVLGLPRRDFIPITWEEKIVCVADKLGVFEWDGILEPQKWLTEVDNRFARLEKRYGISEPFQSSMQRAKRFTMELMALAMSE